MLEGGWYVGPENCAETAKKRYGVSDKEITDEQLEALRKNPWKWYDNSLPWE